MFTLIWVHHNYELTLETLLQFFLFIFLCFVPWRQTEYNYSLHRDSYLHRGSQPHNNFKVVLSRKSCFIQNGISCKIHSLRVCIKQMQHISALITIESTTCLCLIQIPAERDSYWIIIFLVMYSYFPNVF